MRILKNKITWVLGGIAIYCLFNFFIINLQAKSVMHQELAELNFLEFVILFCSIGIINAIKSSESTYKKLPFDRKHNQINNKNEEWEWQYLDEDGNSVEGN